LQSATGKLHSAVLFGGIAQLVERQLCKLEVRGSNPLASSLRSRRRGEQRLSLRSLREGGQMNFRLPIADLRFLNCALARDLFQIENRQLQIGNPAAMPPIRACSSVG
jgi:hypothetical protein